MLCAEAAATNQCLKGSQTGVGCAIAIEPQAGTKKQQHQTALRPDFHDHCTRRSREVTDTLTICNCSSAGECPPLLSNQNSVWNIPGNALPNNANPRA